MSKMSVTEFAAKIQAKNRICFGDVQRLQRDVLPDGITSREEAETLIGLDRQVPKIDSDWALWLIPAIVQFVVWGERPTGVVQEETVNWLVTALAGDGVPPATRMARHIAREIAEEAHAFENEALAALLGLAGSPGHERRAGKRAPKSEAAAEAAIAA
jgi:hypothetical protein